MDHDTMVANISEAVRRCDDDIIGEGCDWYEGRAPKVIRTLMAEHGTPKGLTAGVLAACNVNTSWKGSITMASKMLALIARGITITAGHLQTVCKAIRRMAAGERPTTVLAPWPKIVRFYRNMMGDYEVVTVDRWAARVAGAEALLGRAGGYEAIEAAYQCAANEVGLPPAMCQAVAWCGVRGTGN